MTVSGASLLVVRHGQSVWNAEGRWQGRADPALTPLGEQQAADAALHVGLRVDARDVARAAEHEAHRAAGYWARQAKRGMAWQFANLRGQGLPCAGHALVLAGRQHHRLVLGLVRRPECKRHVLVRRDLQDRRRLLQRLHRVRLRHGAEMRCHHADMQRRVRSDGG